MVGEKKSTEGVKTKRRYLKPTLFGLLVLLAVGVVGTFAARQVANAAGEEKGPIKVGILHSLCGTMAISETVAQGHRADGHRRDQRQGRRARQEARAGGGRSGLELAAVRREGAAAAGSGQGGGDLRLLDLGVPQVGAAGVRGEPTACCSTRCSTKAKSARGTSSTPAPRPTSRPFPRSNT
ncbi:MAG: hypothetical protein MPW14_14070 [Candidatus Manganitrophus sp.]|nr:MAG: hypothetical protein MPW14_14070 [Candidatus Manganitrophus sp.]